MTLDRAQISGALHFERLDGGPQETAEQQTTIEPQTNGPLYVRGRVRIVRKQYEHFWLGRVRGVDPG